MTKSYFETVSALSMQVLFLERQLRVSAREREMLQTKADQILEEARSLRKAWAENLQTVDQVIAELHNQEAENDRLRQALEKVEVHCPCGARPETLETHPHTLDCPVGQALGRPGIPEAYEKAVAPE